MSAPALSVSVTDGLGGALILLHPTPAQCPIYISPVKWEEQSSHSSCEKASEVKNVNGGSYTMLSYSHVIVEFRGAGCE